MNRKVLIFVVMMGFIGVFSSTISSVPPQDIRDRQGPEVVASDDLNSKVATSPREFREGTATLKQIKSWIAQEDPGEPKWIIEEPDLDLNGMPDLLVADDRNTGTGGRNYEAFLRTKSGFRYVGELGSAIRPLPAVGGHARVVMAGHISAGEVGVALAELRPNGLHRLASAVLAAGDQGTVEGSRLCDELMTAPTVSVEILRLIFGPKAYPTSGKTSQSER
jgi:hypothetical protein